MNKPNSEDYAILSDIFPPGGRERHILMFPYLSYGPRNHNNCFSNLALQKQKNTRFSIGLQTAQPFANESPNVVNGEILEICPPLLCR